MLKISATGIEIHTPSTPSIKGKIKSGIMRKISVRNSDRIADILPSLSAVKNPEANKLNPISKNATAKINVPRTAISSTVFEPSANNNAIGFAYGNVITKVITDITAMVFRAIR